MSFHLNRSWVSTLEPAWLGLRGFSCWHIIISLNGQVVWDLIFASPFLYNYGKISACGKMSMCIALIKLLAYTVRNTKGLV